MALGGLMWRSLAILLLCLSLKAQFVFGTEAKLVGESITNEATVTPEKEIKVTMTKTESYELADAASVLGTKRHHEEYSSAFSLYPMMGTSIYSDGWNNNVGNSYIVGLGVEVPTSTWLSLNLEGTFGDYDLRYRQYGTGIVANHNFSLATGSGFAKIYLADGWLRPYVAGGMDALYYDGQAVSGYRSPFSRWIGAASAMAGAEVELTRNLALGVRASYTRPFLNLPSAFDPISAYPEGNVMQVSYFRFMGNVRVAL